jgi:hypothetical protein
MILSFNSGQNASRAKSTLDTKILIVGSPAQFWPNVVTLVLTLGIAINSLITGIIFKFSAAHGSQVNTLEESSFKDESKFKL